MILKPAMFGNHCSSPQLMGVYSLLASKCAAQSVSADQQQKHH